MTSVRHWLNLEKGAGPPFSCFCSLGSVTLFPLPTSLPPSGASYWCFSPGRADFGVIKGLETSDPRACLLSWTGQTCLRASHILPGLRCLLVLCPKSHRGEGELGKESVLKSDFSSLCLLVIYLLSARRAQQGALIFNKS